MRTGSAHRAFCCSLHAIGFPDGLANSSGLVGKRLMMHPFSAVLGVYDEDLESWRGPFGQKIDCYQFYETDEKRGFVRGAKWGAMPTGGPLGATSFVGTKIFSDREATIDDAWGANLHEVVDRRFGHSIVWGIIGEDLPEESNRVTLDPCSPTVTAFRRRSSTTATPRTLDDF